MQLSIQFQICIICMVAMVTVSMSNRGWQNAWDEPLNFQCRDDRTISYVRSIHSNHYEDRRFEIGCKDIAVGTSKPSACYWTSHYVNAWDSPVNFNCPPNHYMTGMASIHHNHYEDRRWKYYCCLNADVELTNCRLTGWTNQYDGLQNYHLPQGQAIQGANSIHSNYYEDRQYGYLVCTVQRTMDGESDDEEEHGESDDEEIEEY